MHNHVWSELAPKACRIKSATVLAKRERVGERAKKPVEELREQGAKLLFIVVGLHLSAKYNYISLFI